MDREFFRFVSGETLVRGDFLPQAALGNTMRRQAGPLAERAWHEGISVWDDFNHACEFAASIKFRRGAFLARIVIPDGSDIEIIQLGRNLHHYTIFATPERMLELVVGAIVHIPGAP